MGNSEAKPTGSRTGAGQRAPPSRVRSAGPTASWQAPSPLRASESARVSHLPLEGPSKCVLTEQDGVLLEIFAEGELTHHGAIALASSGGRPSRVQTRFARITVRSETSCIAMVLLEP